MMIDQPAAVVLGIDDDGGKLVLPSGAGQAHDMKELLGMAPDLAQHPLPLAQAVNHFAFGSRYHVISDPQKFEADYKAKLASEDPRQPFNERVMRLRDFGVPDFAAIKAPAVSGGHLVFYATESTLGVPYKVECATLTAQPHYTPVPLTPLPPVDEEAQPDAPKPNLTPEGGFPSVDRSNERPAPTR
jgi:hypothetical protein